VHWVLNFEPSNCEDSQALCVHLSKGKTGNRWNAVSEHAHQAITSALDEQWPDVEKALHRNGVTNMAALIHDSTGRCAFALLHANKDLQSTCSGSHASCSCLYNHTWLLVVGG
jgi:hypothetical protein